MAEIGSRTDVEIEVDLLRHMVVQIEKILQDSTIAFDLHATAVIV